MPDERIVDFPLKELSPLFGSRLVHRKLFFEFCSNGIESGERGSLRFCG